MSSILTVVHVQHLGDLLYRGVQLRVRVLQLRVQVVQHSIEKNHEYYSYQ